MAETTHISWADRTWSPWLGCQKVSPACDGCYAEHLMDTRMGRVEWGPHGERKRTSPGYWKQLAKWNREAIVLGRPITVFPSLCDPFDNRAPAGVREEWFAEIRRHPNLLWLLLTKRLQNIARMSEAAGGLPPNAAIGATCEDQTRANQNVPVLLAAKRDLRPAFAFLSCEPLLGPIDLRAIPLSEHRNLDALTGGHSQSLAFDGGMGQAQGALARLAALGPLPAPLPALDLVITGGETDQGAHKARPSHPKWFRDLRDQCASTRVAFHHKQNGEWLPLGDWYADYPVSLPIRAWTGTEWTDDGGRADLEWVARVGKKAAGRLLDGIEHSAMPAPDRAARMPDENAALLALAGAMTRLEELGWRNIIYCPKDGTTFDAIEAGSTGIHPCHYEGEWPDGSWWIADGGDLWPSSRPILFRLRTEPAPLHRGVRRCLSWRQEAVSTKTFQSQLTNCLPFSISNCLK